MSRSPRTGTTDLGDVPAEHGTGLHPDLADAGSRPGDDPGRFDPPTHPGLRPVPAGPAGLQDIGMQDIGMQDATTSIFAAVPDRTGRDDGAEAWADPSWGQRSWDRPDYDDELDRSGAPGGFGGFGGFDAVDGVDGVDGVDAFGPGAAGPGQGPHAHGGDPDLAREAVEAPHQRRTRVAALLVPTVVGVAVSVGLGAYARLHEGTGTALNLAGFSSGLAAKSWLTAAAFVLVLVQLWTSMRMYGRFARRRPAGPRTATVHRWSGRLAVLVTIPVAVHCLYALGYSDATLRVLLHSLLGCFFYGAFAAKMLVLPRHDAPRWALPLLGGLVFTALTVLFLTSSVWFFTTRGLTF